MVNNHQYGSLFYLLCKTWPENRTITLENQINTTENGTITRKPLLLPVRIGFLVTFIGKIFWPFMTETRPSGSGLYNVTRIITASFAM